MTMDAESIDLLESLHGYPTHGQYIDPDNRRMHATRVQSQVARIEGRRVKYDCTDCGCRSDLYKDAGICPFCFSTRLEVVDA